MKGLTWREVATDSRCSSFRLPFLLDRYCNLVEKVSYCLLALGIICPRFLLSEKTRWQGKCIRSLVLLVLSKQHSVIKGIIACSIVIND